MSTSSSTTTAVSAPGKVLLAGGYLALDRQYNAFVYGLSARINAVTQEIPTSDGVQLSEFVVTSPQFIGAEWRYGYHLAPDDGGIKVTQLSVGKDMKPNPFVETTLSYVLTYIHTSLQQAQGTAAPQQLAPARITILADNDYYSNPSTNSDGNNRFAKYLTTLPEAHKTGLGSSAALVTSLTASLLSHFLPPQIFLLSTNSPSSLSVLHNLAQAAHCAAQGKVGSGFDVAAAVYGSCKYRRFSPEVLSSLPDSSTPGFAPALFACVNNNNSNDNTTTTTSTKKWDTETLKTGMTHLPPGLALRFCDVDCGSQTVGMVKSVLAWRKEQPGRAGGLWEELQLRNEELVHILSTSANAEEAGTKIPEAIAKIRELVRAMGTESGVPIEPESQTSLLDGLTEAVEGVYGGVVPGAGGFDAVALLVRDDEETEKGIREFVAGWGKEHGGKVRLLGVKGEMEGVRAEGEGEYKGWLL